MLHLVHTTDTTTIYASHIGREQTLRYVCSLPTRLLLSVLDGLAGQYQFRERPLMVAEDSFDVSSVQENLDAESARLINEIHERITQLQQRGMSLRTLREALLQYQTPSRLIVTTDLRLLLADYNNLEIPLTPLCKALYLLYLRHPEGIAFKELYTHHDELLALYQAIAPTLNPARISSHIQRLTNPLDNALNEKVSLIRRAFAKHLDDNLLPFYVIQGEKAERRRVHLPVHLLMFVKK